MTDDNEVYKLIQSVSEVWQMNKMESYLDKFGMILDWNCIVCEKVRFPRKNMGFCLISYKNNKQVFEQHAIIH